MNTYKKYCPNVFVAKCENEQAKGNIIEMTTKYGQTHEVEVHNFLGKTNDNCFLYSITRTDGFNAQERAKNKAEKLNGYASNAEKRSTEAYKRADLSEGATGIPFGQPILVGHHSESRHRKTIERADNAMRKSIDESDKADDYQRRAKYWEAQANKINLSMPESLEYFEYKLEGAKREHQDMKDNPEKRRHSMSLQYANKEVKETQKKIDLAIKLWGSDEEIKLINQEKEQEAKKKADKGGKFQHLIDKYGGFWFFGTDTTLFKEKYQKLLEDGYVEQGDKVTHIIAGLYIPVKHKAVFISSL